MGNMPSDSDPGVSVSRKSTWSVTSPGHAPAFTEYRETITENGVTHVRYHTSRDAYPGSGSGRDFHHHHHDDDFRHHQAERPPVFGSGPERGLRGVRAEDGHFVTGQDGKPLPEVRGQQRAPPPPRHRDDGREPPLGGGGGGLSAKGTPPSGPSQGDKGNRPGGNNPRPLPQPSSRRQGDPPPPYTPHAQPQSGSEAPFPFSDGADPRVNPQQRSHVLSGTDPTAHYPRDGIFSGGGPGTDPMAPFSSGPRDRGVTGRPLGPKEVAKMERDTSYRTRKAATARFMIMSDVESEKKRMDITKDILNDLARR